MHFHLLNKDRADAKTIFHLKKKIFKRRTEEPRLLFEWCSHMHFEDFPIEFSNEYSMSLTLFGRNRAIMDNRRKWIVECSALCCLELECHCLTLIFNQRRLGEKIRSHSSSDRALSQLKREIVLPHGLWLEGKLWMNDIRLNGDFRLLMILRMNYPMDRGRSVQHVFKFFSFSSCSTARE